MQKYIPMIKKSDIFAGVQEHEIEAMLGCLQTTVRHFKKGEYVFQQGDSLDCLTLLLEGKMLIQQDDYWGNRSIINMILPGEMFGEAYATPQSGTLTNDVLATENSAVIFFDVKQILTVCSSACRFHTTVIRNLFFAISEKNRKLVKKIMFISKRTTKEKLIAYLSEEARQHKNNTFSIPFNRQQLADFLSVDRSAMSNELCKMRDEGMIEFEKNRFTLL